MTLHRTQMLVSIVASMVLARSGHALRVSKVDFPRFVGVLACEDTGEACPGADAGFVMNGLVGDSAFSEPSSPDLAKGNKVVIGFLEGKPFSWNRYAIDFPNQRTKWIVLNELTLGEGNRAFLTAWKTIGDSLEFLKAIPRYFSLDLGELFVQAKTTMSDGSLLLILKGEGSDAGVNVQDFRVVRLKSTGLTATQVAKRYNRSEIPLQKILDKLNSDEQVEPVLDSSLICDWKPSRKAPSGAPWLRCRLSRHRVLYTKDGPQETPVSTDSVLVDVLKGN